jgi:hypothetical protein
MDALWLAGVVVVEDKRRLLEELGAPSFGSIQ